MVIIVCFVVSLMSLLLYLRLVRRYSTYIGYPLQPNQMREVAVDAGGRYQPEIKGHYLNL